MEDIGMLSKRIEVVDLFMQAHLGRLASYFDLDSTENLDDKIRVLREVIEGKPLDEIDGFMGIFELLPKDGLWD